MRSAFSRRGEGRRIWSVSLMSDEGSGERGCVIVYDIYKTGRRRVEDGYKTGVMWLCVNYDFV